VVGIVCVVSAGGGLVKRGCWDGVKCRNCFSEFIETGENGQPRGRLLLVLFQNRRMRKERDFTEHSGCVYGSEEDWNVTDHFPQLQSGVFPYPGRTYDETGVETRDAHYGFQVL